MTTAGAPVRFLRAFYPRLSVRRVAFLFALVAPALAAQPAPSAERLLGDWAAQMRTAWAGVEAVTFVERLERDVEGPRGQQRLVVEADVRLAPDGRDAGRRLRRATLDGQPLGPVRLAALERRRERAYGPAASWSNRPPLLELVGRLRADGPARATSLDGRPAWEVPAVPARSDARVERAVLWFARTSRPTRLLRARVEGRLPNDGTATVEADYTAVGGLDLPRRLRSEVVVRQRRRLRLFTVVLQTEATWSGHAVERR